SPKSLVSKLNTTCRSAMENAIGLCQSRTNYNVEIEHWLLKLLEPAQTDLARIFKHYDVDPAKVSRELTRTLDQLKTGNARLPELSLELMDLMREAWVLASLEFKTPRIRSGYLLAALMSDRNLSSRARTASAELGKIPGERLIKEVGTLIEGSAEQESEAGAPYPEPGTVPGPMAGSKTPALHQFTQNLTEPAPTS